MCKQTLRRVYCAAHDRFARYEREPTRIAIAPLRKLRARRTTTVRFSISKVSSVTVQVFDKHGLRLTRALELPHGAHAIAWTPPSRGRYRLRIAAQGPADRSASRRARSTSSCPSRSRRSTAASTSDMARSAS